MTPDGPGTVRVLHLLDLTGPVVPWDAIAACRACLDRADIDQRVIVFGPSRSVADARALGVEPLRSICPPRARMDAAVSALDLAARELNTLWRPTVVQAWSPDAARAAAEVFHHVQIVDSSGSVGQFFPPVDLSRREPLRKMLEVRPNETVILLATDHAGVGDSRQFVGVLGVIELDDYEALGVMSDRTETHLRAVRFLSAFERQWDCTAVQVPPMAYLPAADMVIWDQGEKSVADDARAVEATGGTARAAVAAGIPVIAADTPLARAILGPAADVIISRDGTVPEFSRIVCKLVRDAEQYRSVSGMLRAHAAATQTNCAPLIARWLGATRALQRVGALA